MKIIHVTIGNPDYRNGGLTRYCTDLANEQKKHGHQIIYLYPGPFTDSKKPQIVKQREGFYCIKNALPVAITYGIDNPDRYMVPVDKNIYKNWLKNVQPDVIHIHSIQGIHKEFFDAAKELSTPMIFTTHDYFPICAKTNLVDWNGEICDDWSPERCERCNRNIGLSATKQKVIQSDLYQKLKQSALVKAIKPYVTKFSIKTNRRVKQYNSIQSRNSCLEEKSIEKWNELRMYYKEIMSDVSIIHANSELTGENYRKAFPDTDLRVIDITHSGIKKVFHKKSDTIIHFSYMGGMNANKGFNVLMSACKILENDKSLLPWDISLYGGDYLPEYNKGRFYTKGYFNADEADKVWRNTDVLIVPSNSYETFGFVVVESLARQIPVIVSDLVGAAYLEEKISSSLIFKHGEAKELVEKMKIFVSE